MRHPGELSITEAAELLEVHPDTVRTWAQKTLSGMPSRFSVVRLDVVGRYWVMLGEVRTILKDHQESNYL